MLVRLLVAALLACSSLSLAAPTKNDAERQARELYRSGLSNHNLADYPAAIADFKRAYSLTHAPGLLFNLAQSSRLGKDYEQALHFYRTYLRELPNAPNRRDVEGLIVKVEALLRPAETKPETKPATPAPPAPEPEVRVVLVPTPIAPATEPRIVDRPPDPRRRRTLLTAGLVTLGVGVLALAGGLGAGLHAQSQADSLNALRSAGGMWSAQAQSTYSDGSQSSTAAIALYAVGGALAVAGIAVTVVAARQPHSPRLALRWQPLVGGASLEAACVF